jgi:DNA helicase-2/ATP-dependent DNA helicase PcrA
MSQTITAEQIADALGLHRPTPAQRAVIEAPLEPALVVAGAGSGKTETMSARVLWLVANGHVRADQILGLTFTRKAAGELAERISHRLAALDEYASRGLLPHVAEVLASPEFQRIGRGATDAQRAVIRREVLDGLAARWGVVGRSDEHSLDAMLNRPRVSTYNAFADSVVRENASRIGRDPDAEVLSGSAAWLLTRQVVMAANHPGLVELERSPNTIVEDVQRLSGALLDNRADPEAVRRWAERRASDFAPFLTARGDKHWDKAHAALAALPMLLDLVEAYTVEKQRRGLLEFSDQVSGALDIIESAPDVVAELREQYPVVLLDEYQDTSVLQTRLLAGMFRGLAVMAVGDPNQSIYGWRGASSDNMHAFTREFAAQGTARTYALMTSWRNDRIVLAAANRLVRPLALPGTVAVPPLEPSPFAGIGDLEIRYPESVDEEAEAVAGWFDERRAEHAASHPGGTPHTGAILFRAKKHMQRFADALTARGIPHRILGLGGLLSAPEVVDLVSALRVIHSPAEGSALIRLLIGPRFAVGVADMGALYDLAVELNRRDGSLAPLSDEVRDRMHASAGIDEQVSIIDALDFLRRSPDGYRLLEGFTAEGRVRLREAAEVVERLRRSAGAPIPELLRMVEQELRLDIELFANETRGSARSSQLQLRAFAEEVRGFLSIDERGTLGSLLAWIDQAERTDDLAPRTEPPEPGVVQLLTVHGSKGLEWDAVAVVRLVAGELPSSPRELAAGFSFGHLPDPFRGDAAARPVFEWTAPAVVVDDTRDESTVELAEAFETFRTGVRDAAEREDRRLAYVAVTRARGHLLLTGSHWAGQTRPRAASTYLDEILQEIEARVGAAEQGLVGGGEPGDDHGLFADAAVRERYAERARRARERTVELDKNAANPYAGTGAHTEWPLDPLGSRRPAVEAAAKEVHEAPRVAASPEIQRLLAERDENERVRELAIPVRVPASKFKDYVVDFEGTIGELERPMPERPYRQTRLGTLFHQWVERRSGLTGSAASPEDALWDLDDGEEWSGAAAGTAEDERDLAVLREIFERSEWAQLEPVEVETEVDFALELDEGRPPHIMICKLDAVYRRGDRIEIVDWKTGRAPQTAAEKADRMLQLALYRLAYHRRHGVPLEQIDAVLYYVPDDLVLRDEHPADEREIVERWRAATSGRTAGRPAA